MMTPRRDERVSEHPIEEHVDAHAYESSATGAVDENDNDNDLFDAVACGPGATVR